MKKISVVTSLYLSSPYVLEFHRRHLACIERMGLDYEFVFVDDGSPDGSAAAVEALMKSSPKIKLVRLSRNFGQAAAMFAAMGQAKGDYIYAVDSDLEEIPENISRMYDLIRDNDDVDVVYGVAPKRQGGVVRAVLGKAFYLILDLLSTVKVPHDQTWQRIMSRRYVESLLLYGEGETLPAGLMVLAGFNQVPIEVEKRFKGSTSYTLRRRLVLALDSLVSFSSRPAMLISLTGIAISALSFVVIAFLVYAKLTHASFRTGWVSVIASIWCVCGVLLTSIGVMGIYIVKIFNQVKQRPRYVIKSVRES